MLELEVEVLGVLELMLEELVVEVLEVVVVEVVLGGMLVMRDRTPALTPSNHRKKFVFWIFLDLLAITIFVICCITATLVQY